MPIWKIVLGTHTRKSKILIKILKAIKMYPWKHQMDEIYFNQVFCASYGIKRKQENWKEIQEKVYPVICWKTN